MYIINIELIYNQHNYFRDYLTLINTEIFQYTNPFRFYFL